MTASFVVTLAISLWHAARFCTGDADDIAMNQQVKQCAAAIKSDLQATIANDQKCTVISKVCTDAYSTMAVRLQALECGRQVSNGNGVQLGADLIAKLRCPGQHAEATSNELLQRLCLAPKFSPKTKDKYKEQFKILRTDTPSDEFVDGLMALADTEEVGPDLSRLATFLGQAETEARGKCSKYAITCDPNAADGVLRTSVAGDGCRWVENISSDHDEHGSWRKKGTIIHEKRTDPISVNLYSLAREFKLQNPKTRISKIMSSIDALHCGNDKSVVGKKSFEKYAAALGTAAAKI